MDKDFYPVDPQAAAHANLDRAGYARDYAASIADPDAFWAQQAKRLDWTRFPTRIKDVSYDVQDFRIRWFDDGELNASVNCLDRHLAEHGDKTALIFEPDDPATPAERISYRELHARVCRLANALRHLGVGKGDRVTIYLPMIPEAVVALLACARIGAIHMVVFGGFAPNSIADRVADCNSKLIITADEGLRGGKKVPLKANVDAALKLPGTNAVETVLVVRHTGAAVDMQMPRDRWYDAVVDGQPDTCTPENMNAEDPLFILYTSGSTGKPKGVLHTTGGYLLWSAYTHALSFDLKPGDVYWCTADIGWVTGHSYIVYGPLANGCTGVLFEGVPNFPDFSRFWQVIDKHQVSIFYTAPTAIRALMREGDGPVKATSRASLRVLGSVGEPINPEAWRWYHDVIGDGRCPVIDTWWQTETGGILISPIPGATDLKPGSATLPLPGVQPALVDAEGKLLDGVAEGNLVMLDSWPGQMRTVYGDHPRFIDTYFKAYPGMYFSGDGCRRHDLKGQGIYAYAAGARQRRRADQSGSLALVSRCHRRRALSGHRYLVADRNRRHPDQPDSRCHRSQARLGHLALARRAAGAGRCRRQAVGRRGRRQPGDARFLAWADAHGVWRSPALHRHLFQGLSGHVFQWRWLPPRW